VKQRNPFDFAQGKKERASRVTLPSGCLDLRSRLK
jgi:hypothetical protein